MMLQRLRMAMVRPGRERLSGRVEVHEPKGFGRARLARVPDVSAGSLIAFVEASVEPGASVLTDGWSAYGALPVHGYPHSKTVLSASGDPAQVAMPAVHRVASLLKRWLLGTHQGSVSAQHLQAYLNEFPFLWGCFYSEGAVQLEA